MPRTVTVKDAEAIGRRLREARERAGLSQRQLAAAASELAGDGAGLTAAYISRIEAGARRPTFDALRLLAPPCGVAAEFLETGSTASSFALESMEHSTVVAALIAYGVQVYDPSSVLAALWAVAPEPLQPWEEILEDARRSFRDAQAEVASWRP